MVTVAPGVLGVVDPVLSGGVSMKGEAEAIRPTIAHYERVCNRVVCTKYRHETMKIPLMSALAHVIPKLKKHPSRFSRLSLHTRCRRAVATLL